MSYLSKGDRITQAEQDLIDIIGSLGAALTVLRVNAAGTSIEWAASGAGTVTSVSVVSANGISGSVATATTTPAITLTLGAITPTSVAIAGTAGAGYLSLPHQSSAPASPSAGIALLSASTGNGFTRVVQNNESLEDIVIGRDNVFIAKNTSGGAITKGQVVYVTGSVGAVPTVSLAKADSLTTLAATIGIATETSVANNGFGQFMIVGILDNIDTSAFTTGNSVYVSATTAGLLTNTKPAYPNFQKFVGVVLNSGVGNGSILINVAPFNGGAELGTNASIFYGTNIQLSGLTASEIVGTDASKNLVSLAVATYPSLTELAYVKGVTSAIQTQLGTKQATITFGTGVQTALGVNVGSAGAPVLFDGALGTPSAGTLTNCTGLPVAGITASTSTALGVGSVELGHASDTTIARVSAGVASIEGNTIVVNTASPTLATITTTGNIELGHASDTTISRVSAGVVAIEGVNILTTAGGTLTGNITLGENTSIALDPAGSADGKYTGITVAGTAGEALAFGDVIVLDATAGKWFKGSVSAAAGADGDLRGGTGMCVLAAAGDASATTVLLMGTCRADANFPALTVGSVVYATTAGDITTTQPTTTDHIIKVLGYALTADEIMFCPSMDYITHT